MFPVASTLTLTFPLFSNSSRLSLSPSLSPSTHAHAQVITDRKWLETTFVPTVAQRGGALIQTWGKSSAASTAVSVCDAIRSLVRS